MSASVVLWGEVASLAHATPVVPAEPYDHLVSQDTTSGVPVVDAPKLWMNWWLPHFPASGVATALSPTRTWTDMHWHPDGSFVYLTNSAQPTASTSELVKYTASTPWTASTLSLTWTRGAKKSLYNLANPAVVPPPTAMTADVTGNKIFLAFQNLDADGDGDSDIAIHQYDVSDMSTIEASFPFSEAAGTIHSMKWRADGERLFISQNSYVKQYRATTPWDITELTFETQIQATSGTDNDIVWKPTGEKLYVVQGTSISSYVPSPAFNVWNLPTMSLVNTKTGMSSGSRLAWKSDGTRFFQLSGSSIKQHDFTGI